jgi:hypothetical protein
VFDYGFNVETAGDSPVWHRSERNLLPGHKARATSKSEPAVDLTAEDVRPPVEARPSNGATPSQAPLGPTTGARGGRAG